MNRFLGAAAVTVFLATGQAACASTFLAPNVATVLTSGTTFDTGSVVNGSSVTILENYYFTVGINESTKAVETTFEPVSGDNVGIEDATLTWYSSLGATGPSVGPALDTIQVTDASGNQIGLQPSMTLDLAPGFYDLVVAGVTESQGGNYDLSVRGFRSTDTEGAPLPAALPLFASGLGLLGFWGRRRKKVQLAV